MRLTIATAMKAALAAYAIALTVGAAHRLVPVIRDQLAAPFDLISEGPHLEAIKAFRDGYNIYAPESYHGPPFRIIPYMPLFHGLIAILPNDPANPFFTGRLLSMLFLFAAAASLFALARPRDWLGIPLIAFACFFLIRPIVSNTAYIRSDSPGLFFSVCAIVLVAATPTTSRRAIGAGALCAVAIACKQSYPAATATCFLYLLARDRRLAALFAATMLTVAAVLAAIATKVWGRGFWFCIFLPATQYPRDWESFFLHWNDMWSQPVFTCIAATVGLVCVAALVRRNFILFTGAPYFLYLVLSLVILTSVLSGIGGANHYFFEPILAALLWLLWSRTRTSAGERLDWKTIAVLMALGVCAVAELRDTDGVPYRNTTAADTAHHVQNREWVMEQMARLGIRHGELLNFKDSPVTFDYSTYGHMNVDDPYLFFVLWTSGGLSSEPLLRAIADHYFDAVIVAPTLVDGRGQSDDQPIQHIIKVMFQHYKLAIHSADVNVLIPRT